jgi:hypothetical protein
MKFKIVVRPSNAVSNYGHKAIYDNDNIVIFTTVESCCTHICSNWVLKLYESLEDSNCQREILQSHDSDVS